MKIMGIPVKIGIPAKKMLTNHSAKVIISKHVRESVGMVDKHV